MRVLVTVVQEGAPPHDVMVNADDDATAGDVAQALAVAPGDGPGQAGHPLPVVVALPGTVLDPRYQAQRSEPTLWADGHRCEPDTPAGQILRDGMRISVDE